MFLLSAMVVHFSRASLKHGLGKPENDAAHKLLKKRDPQANSQAAQGKLHVALELLTLLVMNYLSIEHSAEKRKTIVIEEIQENL